VRKYPHFTMKINKILSVVASLTLAAVSLSLTSCSAPGGADVAAAPLGPGYGGVQSRRSGLSTADGGERYSKVRAAEFFRKGASPDAVASFHYNDERGAKAMAEGLGGGHRCSSLVELAGGRLRAGLVKTGYYEGGSVYPSLSAGEKRIFVGQADEDYGIEVVNRSNKRLEVIVTVDGLNVMNAQPASYKQHGYVLEPKQSARIDGFRKDMTKVHAFKFGSVAEGVAARKGGGRNVGVVGFAVFEEDESKQKAHLLGEQVKRTEADAFPVGF
jgi:hypothetical protein